MLDQPEDLARDLQKWIRARPNLTPDTVALLEAQALAEVRRLKIVRLWAFFFLVLPVCAFALIVFGLFLMR